MTKTAHAFRRSLEAALHYQRLGKKRKTRLAAALDVLRPFQTDCGLFRLGPATDGGYLLPDCLDGIAAGFSPGVSDEIGFDRDLLNRGIPVHMADASLPAAPSLPEGATFDALFLGAETRDHWISLPDWIAARGPAQGDLILQMDIEGHEYDVLASLPRDVLQRFRILVIEFHHLHRFPRRGHFDRIEQALQKLADDFVCVHLHPNNVAAPVKVGPHRIPPFFEATLLRRDHATGQRPNDRFPHPLDAPCAPDQPDYAMSRFWS